MQSRAWRGLLILSLVSLCAACGSSKSAREEAETSAKPDPVAEYRKALAGVSRNSEPLKWAAVQYNLGSALKEPYEDSHGSGTTGHSPDADLNAAINAYQAALEEFDRSKQPREWATIYYHLGRAQQLLAEHENEDAALLSNAADSFRLALEETPRRGAPLAWARSNHFLGEVLLTLSQKDGDVSRLPEAETAFRSALLERKHEVTPVAWAESWDNLGHTLAMMGEKENDVTRLKQALEAYDLIYERHYSLTAKGGRRATLPADQERVRQLIQQLGG